MLKIPRVVRELGEVFDKAGHQCYLVGGAVRDLYMGRQTQDYDIATDATPERVSRIFRRVIPTGIDHGTVTVHYQEMQFEVTTFRSDGAYTDGRRPDSVDYLPTIEGDLARRDFTINALAVRVPAGVLVDLHRGREDIAAKVIRAIGDPAERFREDGLRLMRACRFAAQLEFVVEPATMAAMAATREAIRPVAAERVRDELARMLASPTPSQGLELMRATGLLGIVLPELQGCVGVEQRGMHCFDVWRHSLESCDAAPRESLVLRLSALLHDVGKPAAAVRGPAGEWTFHRHEEIGAVIAEGLLKRLRFPNTVLTAVLHLVRCHMFHYTPDWSDGAVRRFVARVGTGSLDDVLALRRADQIGTCGNRGVSESLIELEQRIRDLRVSSEAFTIRDLAVDGRGLMQALGLPPGPVIGVLLQELLESVLDDPSLNQPETLLGIAKRFYEARIRPGGGMEGG